ncbi:hypothetical protein AAY473_029407 [Plecturocebus cupreus]
MPGHIYLYLPCFSTPLPCSQTAFIFVPAVDSSLCIFILFPYILPVTLRSLQGGHQCPLEGSGSCTPPGRGEQYFSWCPHCPGSLQPLGQAEMSEAVLISSCSRSSHSWKLNPLSFRAARRFSTSACRSSSKLNSST